MFVMTKPLSQQAHSFLLHFCFVFVSVMTKVVVTSRLLSRQKTCFIATKIILVAAPADDKYEALPLIMPRSNPSLSIRKYGLFESKDVEILKVQL